MRGWRARPRDITQKEVIDFMRGEVTAQDVQTRVVQQKYDTVSIALGDREEVDQSEGCTGGLRGRRHPFEAARKGL